MAAVNSLHGDKTLVIVAHRLSTVAGCDLLYRLEEGHVTRSGTFAEVTAS
jgi:ABC-type multidrug transport system fused ATPase/permease subunit